MSRGELWILANIFGLFFTINFSKPEPYDVTTFCRYDVDLLSGGDNSTRLTVEIHARNNALGLPFLLPDGTVIGPNVGIDVEQCAPMEGMCKWKQENFKSIPYFFTSPLEFSAGNQLSQTFFISSNDTESFQFYKGFSLTFQARVSLYGNPVFGIFLMDEVNSLTLSDLYYIYLSPDSSSYLLKCKVKDNSYGRISYSFTSRLSRNCIWKQEKRRNRGPWNVPVQSKDNFEISNQYRIFFYEGQIKISYVRLNEEYEIFNFIDPDAIDVMYYKFGTYGMSGTVKGDFKPNMWVLSEEEGFMTSPAFEPSSSRVCVSVTFHKESEDSLYLTLLQPNHRDVNFTSVYSVSLPGGWESSRFTAQLSNEKENSSVMVNLTAKKSEGSEILVQWIAGCNADDMEDILVLPRAENIRIPTNGYDIAVVSGTKSEGDSKVCKNGGKFIKTIGFCICPAGFIGSTCETGCGINRFGSKCDGQCSNTKRGCKGMKLCPPGLPCTCAPGFEGTYCDFACGNGEYGADCKQKCGHCNKAPCNRYTGICHSGCKPGYYPPYCQEYYSHLLVAPVVTVDKKSPSIQITASLNSNNIGGIGTPKFCKFQYIKSETMKLGNTTWLEPNTRPIDGLSVVNAFIFGLEPATHYQARVVLVDSDGGSYQGPDIAVKELRTSCNVPEAAEYHFHTISVSEDSIQVAWTYTFVGGEWCPLLHFDVELKEKWGWVKYYQGKGRIAVLSGLLPGQQYHVRIRAVTIDGPVSYSDILTIQTKDEVPLEVFTVELVAKGSSKLEVKWTPPLNTAGTIRSYRVAYKCQKLLACSEDCNYSAGEVELMTTSVVLHDLLSHAQYLVSVAARSASWGPETQILGLTDMTVPNVSPDPSSTSVTQRTNTSFTVHWDHPHNCSQINGYLYGYQYMLFKDTILIGNDSTLLTSATFKDLVPHTEYVVKVYLMTSEGWSSSRPLLISAKTKSTAPEPVEHLTVYKRGRYMLGLRWATSTLTYGEIESFTISYRKLESDGSPMSRVIKPTPCAAWDHLFCHTLKNLHADTSYEVTVQARNTEVPEDGEPTTVTAVTKESAPGSPLYVQVKSQEQDSLLIEWGIPDMVNGVLRSFIINIEESESFNSTECCQYFPVQEVLTKVEQASYQQQFTGLQPASTYIVSVSAKTIAMGPAATITAHTKPPVPTLDNTIEMLNNSNSPTVLVHPAKEYMELTRGYLIVVVLQSPEMDFTDATVWNTVLYEELRDIVNGSFYLAAELPTDIEDSYEVTLGAEHEERNGTWGIVQNTELSDGTEYRIGLVAVLDYCGVLSVGYEETDTFQVNY